MPILRNPEEFNKEMCELHATLPPEEFKNKGAELITDQMLVFGYTSIYLYFAAPDA